MGMSKKEFHASLKQSQEQDKRKKEKAKKA